MNVLEALWVSCDKKYPKGQKDKSIPKDSLATLGNGTALCFLLRVSKNHGKTKENNS